MPVFKDKKRNSWYAAFYYTDWTGKRLKKLKRGFANKKEAQDWENQETDPWSRSGNAGRHP